MASPVRAEIVERPMFHRRLALGLVVALGFAARAAVVLDPPCLPGQDGAYYFVQVRGILRGEGLPVPDLPLLFYALACIARILTLFQDTASAIVSAVRWTDAVVPLSLAFPVYLLARDTPPGRAGLATLLPGLLAVASGNVLMLAAGAIKNGAVLPLCLFYVYWLARWDQRRSWGALLLGAVFLLASCLTHLSALPVALAFTVPWVCLRVARHPDRRLLVIAAGLAVAVGMAIVVEPARGGRALGTVLRPWTAVSPDWGTAIQQPAVWLGNALGVLGLVALGRKRRELEPWARDLLAASSLASLVLSSPVLRPELLERLALVSLVPGLVVAVFLSGWLRMGPTLLAPLLALALAHGGLAVKTLRATGLTQPAFDELEAVRGVLPDGPRIVMVRPLLRWWAAWTLDSKFSTSVAGVMANRDAYAVILVLDEIRPGAFGLAPSRIASKPGSALRDGADLERASFEVLSEGTYFRLSRLLPTGEIAATAACPLCGECDRRPNRVRRVVQRRARRPRALAKAGPWPRAILPSPLRAEACASMRRSPRDPRSVDGVRRVPGGTACNDERSGGSMHNTLRGAIAALMMVGALAMPAAAAELDKVLPFISDDYPRALAEARAQKLPLFVEFWAPW
jgi:hypothetical protein